MLGNFSGNLNIFSASALAVRVQKSIRLETGESEAHTEKERGSVSSLFSLSKRKECFWPADEINCTQQYLSFPLIKNARRRAVDPYPPLSNSFYFLNGSTLIGIEDKVRLFLGEETGNDFKSRKGALAGGSPATRNGRIHRKNGRVEIKTDEERREKREKTFFWVIRAIARLVWVAAIASDGHCSSTTTLIIALYVSSVDHQQQDYIYTTSAATSCLLSPQPTYSLPSQEQRKRKNNNVGPIFFFLFAYNGPKPDESRLLDGTVHAVQSHTRVTERSGSFPFGHSDRPV